MVAGTETVVGYNIGNCKQWLDFNQYIGTSTEIVNSGWGPGSCVLKEIANGTVMNRSQNVAGNAQMLKIVP
jgi:hypothetical protein